MVWGGLWPSVVILAEAEGKNETGNRAAYMK